MGVGIIIGIIVLVLIVAILIWWIATYNNIRKTDLKCQEAESGIDVALTKRHDMLTKLLAAAKQYQGYEKATILETINLRKDAPMAQKIENANKLDKAQNVLFGLAENYPDLKASANWQELQRGVEDTEEHLAAAKRAANSNCTAYNNYIVTFPSSIVAKSMGANTLKEYFEATEEQKQDVVIE